MTISAQNWTRRPSSTPEADPLVRELLAEYEQALEGAAVAPPNGASAENKSNIESFMRSISAELDALLPEPAMTPPSELHAADPMPVREAESADNRGPLGDVFDEFRAEIDENGEREDPETHYNLGIAYREMGLMEEAISEFQKVASAHQQGQSFRYADAVLHSCWRWRSPKRASRPSP